MSGGLSTISVTGAASISRNLGMLPDSWRGHFVRVPAQVKNLRDTSGKMPELRPESDLNRTSENLPTLSSYDRRRRALANKSAPLAGRLIHLAVSSAGNDSVVWKVLDCRMRVLI